MGSLCDCVHIGGGESDTGGIRSMQGITWDERARRLGCFLGADVVWSKYATSPLGNKCLGGGGVGLV